MLFFYIYEVATWSKISEKLPGKIPRYTQTNEQTKAPQNISPPWNQGLKNAVAYWLHQCHLFIIIIDLTYFAVHFDRVKSAVCDSVYFHSKKLQQNLQLHNNSQFDHVWQWQGNYLHKKQLVSQNHYIVRGNKQTQKNKKTWNAKLFYI